MALEDIKLPGQDYWAGTGRRPYYGEESDPDQYGEGDFWLKILKEGYVPLDTKLGGSQNAIGSGAAYDPQSWAYFNQNYGTNIKSPADYYRIVYQQPNAEVVNDPRLGPLLKVGPDAVEKRFLNYNPNPNEELFQALKVGGAAFGAAGLLSASGVLAAGGGAAGTGAGAAGTIAGEVGGAGSGLAGAGGAATGTIGSGVVNSGYGVGGELYGPLIDTSATGAFDAGIGGSGILEPGYGGTAATTAATTAGKAAAGGLTQTLTSMGLPAGLAETIGTMFPNATVGSIMGGLLQGGLGYLGAEKQADAIKSAQEIQNSYIQQAIDASEKARTEQNVAYKAAHDETITARDKQNAYIQQAIDEAKKGILSQDAAIQSGIDFSRGASDKYFGLGAPYRGILESTYKPGYSVFDDSATRDAATQAANYAARGYSSTSGNPFDQPSAQGGIYRDVMQQVALPQLNTMRSQLGTFGQTGLQQAGAFDALAAGGMANLGNNDLYTVPLIASLGNNAFAGINYTANQADSGKYTDYLASLGNNAFQSTPNAGSGLTAIGYGLNQAFNPSLTVDEMIKRWGYYGTENQPAKPKPP